MDFWGHSENGNGHGVPEALHEHISAVARRAKEYAEPFGAADQAELAGMLHDLGKYAEQFQERVRGRGMGRDHASIGAMLTAAFYKELGLVPALAIQGHHVGLPHLPRKLDSHFYANELATRIKCEGDRFTSGDVALLQKRYLDDGFGFPKLSTGLIPSNRYAAADLLDVRMLFSTLVDADFLETEAHFDGDAKLPRRPRPDGPTLDFDRAIACLNDEVARFGEPTNELLCVRRKLYEACVHAADHARGLFTLSAPTGSGKTLAMLAFALHHAKAHGLRRVVLVMPFLNIIEQTAQIYRTLFNANASFPAHTILEHHSLVRDHGSDAPDGVGKQSRHRLLAENWDAPIVLTTNVQCLESLMAHKPARCRKLHRLAKSVILFDEAQTLPLPLAKATLATLSRLADPQGPFGSTVLFATATQPAFEVLHREVGKLCAAGWQPIEIAPDPVKMFEIAARRVHTNWRHDQPVTPEALGRELAGHRQVLAIVNLKRHAVALAEAVKGHVDAAAVLHLSTNMCPAHRLKTLADVRERLEANQPIQLIATQCVEAGVDLDFPAVYRAFAPLEAIAQAAGRCNRAGRRPARGQMIVFQIDEERKTYPPGYGQAIDASQSFLAALALQRGCHLDNIEIINDPEQMRAYFRHFYGLQGRHEEELPDEQELHTAIMAGDFAKIAECYKLIRQDAISIVVPHDREVYESLRDRAEAGFADAQARSDWRRDASHYAVSIYRPRSDSPLWNHLGAVQFHPREEPENHSTDWFIALDGLVYDPLIGLVMPEEQWNIA